MKKLMFFAIILLVLAVLIAVLPQKTFALTEHSKSCCILGTSFTVDNKDFGWTPDGTTGFAKGAIIGEPATGATEGAADQSITGCYIGDNPVGSGFATKHWGMVCMLGIVYNITNWIFFILIILSALMIIWGGLQYILAAGDPAKAGKGKTILTLSIIGIAIALLAKVVPSVLKFFLGV